MPDITYDVGRVSFVMRGAWNLATSYEKLDAVSYNGSLYIAKQDVPGGTAITNTTYWQLAAEKGDQGETGNGIASIAKTGTAGNVDTYTITYTDGTTTTFTVTNGGVTTVNGRTGDVTGLAEEAGSYPLLNAGTADNLTPYSEDSGATQSIPFIAQGTGCGNGESVADTGSYLQFKKKLGNTVGVNQLARNGDFADMSAWSNLSAWKSATVSNNTLHLVSNANQAAYINIQQTSLVSPIVGHKYLFLIDVKSSKSTNLGASFGTTAGGCVFNVNGYPANTWMHIALIGTVSSNTDDTLYIRPKASADAEEVDIYIKNVALIDLTIWHGSNDRIPSDLLSHPENWGRYYAGSLDYAAGYLDSADGTVMRSIGRNCFDEQTRNGIYNASTGEFTPHNDYCANKNPIPIIPNTAYYIHSGFSPNSGARDMFFYDEGMNFVGGVSQYTDFSFTTPSNAHFMNFNLGGAYGATYRHDITISLYYSGESGYDQYYPYSVLAEVDTGSEVLRSAGAVADEKTPDGTITRRCAIVNIADLAFSYNSSYDYFYCDLPAMKSRAANEGPGYAYIQSDKYVFMGRGSTGNLQNANYGEMFYYGGGWDTSQVRIKATTTPSSGVIIYELATPTTEQGTAFAENIPCDDFGSMYWTQTKGIPQGNEIFYPVDYKASIDTLYNRVEGDMSKIVTEDEYPEAPSSDGTYVLKATVSGGTKTYAWVAE